MCKKKNLLLIIIFLLLSNYFTHSIVPPQKNKDLGAIVGRAQIYIDKDWDILKSGTYSAFTLYFYNKDTGKKYTVNTYRDGVFYLLNIPEGEYILKSCDFEYEYTEKFMIFYIKDIQFSQEIIFYVEPNSITVSKTIMMNAEFRMIDDGTGKPTIERVFISIEYIDERDFLVRRFKNSDNRNKWANYNYIIR